MVQDFLGRGFAFPIQPVARGSHSADPLEGLRWREGEEKIKESIWIILSSAPGERLMRPEFGCGIHDLVFEPNTSVLHDLVRERVKTALKRFEPRIDVREIKVYAGEREHGEIGSNLLLIDIDYVVRTNNAAHNLVYPFYLQEGAA